MKSTSFRDLGQPAALFEIYTAVLQGLLQIPGKLKITNYLSCCVRQFNRWKSLRWAECKDCVIFFQVSPPSMIEPSVNLGTCRQAGLPQVGFPFHIAHHPRVHFTQYRSWSASSLQNSTSHPPTSTDCKSKKGDLPACGLSASAHTCTATQSSFCSSPSSK